MRLWEKIRKDSRDFGRGFARIRKTFAIGLGEDSRDFGRGIHKDS